MFARKRDWPECIVYRANVLKSCQTTQKNRRYLLTFLYLNSKPEVPVSPRHISLCFFVPPFGLAATGCQETAETVALRRTITLHSKIEPGSLSLVKKKYKKVVGLQCYSHPTALVTPPTEPRPTTLHQHGHDSGELTPYLFALSCLKAIVVLTMFHNHSNRRPRRTLTLIVVVRTTCSTSTDFQPHWIPS